MPKDQAALAAFRPADTDETSNNLILKDGHSLRIVIAKSTTPSPNGSPIIILYHGGGDCIGSPDMEAPHARTRQSLLGNLCFAQLPPRPRTHLPPNPSTTAGKSCSGSPRRAHLATQRSYQTPIQNSASSPAVHLRAGIWSARSRASGSGPEAHVRAGRANGQHRRGHARRPRTREIPPILSLKGVEQTRAGAWMRSSTP